MYANQIRHRSKISVPVLMLIATIVGCNQAAPDDPSQQGTAANAAQIEVGNRLIRNATTKSPDGVDIAYSTNGEGDVALVFVHGGLANRTFFAHQLRSLAAEFQVITLDLAGHGESGANRKVWGIPAFAQDVQAVVETEGLSNVILLGNSLGGPVAIEAALLMPERVIGVVGIDTFQRLEFEMSEEAATLRAEAIMNDHAAAVHAMATSLFHSDANSGLVADVESRMAATPPKVARALFLSLAGYDLGNAAKKLKVPLRAINGDLFETNIAAAREQVPDFDVVILEHVGHYPMLEVPEEFDRQVIKVAEELIQLRQCALPQ